MKRLITLVFAACTLMAAAVSCYNDSALKGEIDNLKDRVSSLEDQMKTANQNISSLQDIIRALENKLFVNSINPTSDGFVLKFSDGTEATIKNGHSPVISTSKDNDVYYWTVDGEWLLDKDGKKIPVTGAAPELKIENGRWLLSTDGGKTWTDAGQATGDAGANGNNGADGDSFFKKVDWDDKYVYLTLADDTTLTLLRNSIMSLLKNIQSIVYVPDYDDLKITVNSTYIFQSTEAYLFDQPTEITYQILPAQYASTLAKGIKEFYTSLKNGELPFIGQLMNAFGSNLNLDSSWQDWRDELKSFGLDYLFAWFDVKPLKTRSGDGKDDLDYGMRILDVVSANDSTGEITFKVLPVNITSQSFLDSGLRPSYEYGITANNNYILGWESWEPFTATGIFAADEYENRAGGQYDVLTIPVWKYEDILAYKNRSAFAVQLRLYHIQGYDMEDGQFIDYENELASSFTTLYPNYIEPVELLPDAYIPGSNGIAKVDGNETQYLPYNVFRKDGTEAEPGYRTILDGVTPAFVIDGKTLSAEEAYELGYFIPGISKPIKTVTFNGKTAGAVLADDENADYIEVEMNPKASESEREAAINDSVESKYTFKTPFGQIECNGRVIITKDGTIPAPGYDLLHLRYYNFNSQRESGSLIIKRDFQANDGSVEWWTQVYPSYFTTTGGTGTSQERMSFRHALADYAPSYINLAELAFNIVDENDEVLTDDEIINAGLEVKFDYKDPSLGSRNLPDLNIDGYFNKYKDLWIDNSIFFYNTNEYPFIPIKASLYKDGKEIPTRFSKPKNSVKYPSESLDYSSYALVGWMPFKAITAEDYTVSVNNGTVNRFPMLQTVDLKDNRPNGVSYYVIKEGEWVIGNVKEFDPEAGTYSVGGNGYVYGVKSKDAYHIPGEVEVEFKYGGIPADLRKLLTVQYSADGKSFISSPENGTLPYLTFDLTSQVVFSGSVTLPVHVKLNNPWQAPLEADFTITLTSSGNNGGNSGNNSWTGSWRVLRKSNAGEIYDTWEITPSNVDNSLLISGIGGFTDQQHIATAEVDADNCLIIRVQYTGTYNDNAHGQVDLYLSGQYESNGQNYFSANEGITLATGIMSDDGKTASLRQGMTNSGYLFKDIQFFGRYASSIGTIGNLSFDDGYSPIPQTIERIGN